MKEVRRKLFDEDFCSGRAVRYTIAKEPRRYVSRLRERKSPPRFASPHVGFIVIAAVVVEDEEEDGERARVSRDFLSKE